VSNSPRAAERRSRSAKLSPAVGTDRSRLVEKRSPGAMRPSRVAKISPPIVQKRAREMMKHSAKTMESSPGTKLRSLQTQRPSP
jgi:hypothetical protein